jgi:hypothetical protein
MRVSLHNGATVRSSMTGIDCVAKAELMTSKRASHTLQLQWTMSLTLITMAGAQMSTMVVALKA